MNLPLADLVPDDAVDDVPGKFVHPQHFLWAQHRLLVSLLADVLLEGISSLMSLTRIHQYLHVNQFIIVLEQVVLLVVEDSGFVLAKRVDINRLILALL